METDGAGVGVEVNGGDVGGWVIVVVVDSAVVISARKEAEEKKRTAEDACVFNKSSGVARLFCDRERPMNLAPPGFISL